MVTLVEGANSVMLSLAPTALMMREAEITALRAGERSPFAQTKVTREELDRINTGVDLPILLDQQPGVVTSTDAGTGIGYTGIRIRGTDATRINVTLNGVPINDAESQAVFWVNMPDLATSVEDVQVQRGVGTSTNGPGAFGASINMRSSTVRRDAFGEVNLSGGSFNTQRYGVRFGTGLLNAGEGKDRSGSFSLDGRLSSIRSDGFVDRATADLQSYFLQGAWMGRDRSLRFITFSGKEVTYQAWAGVSPDVLDTNRTYNPYTYENEVDNYQQTHYQLLFEQRLGDRGTLNITGFRVLGEGYFEQFREEDDLSTYGIEPLVTGVDTFLTSDLIRRRWLDNVLTGVNISTDLALGEHRLLVGGSYSDYRGAHFGELIWSRWAGSTDIRDRYYENDAVKTDANVFAKLLWSLNDRVDLFGDLQLRQVNYSFLGFDNDLENITQEVDFLFVNPKLGLNVRAGDAGRAYASVAVANREPNRDDLTETTPQSRPTSERLTDLEVGYDHREGRMSFGANGYWMEYRDQLVLTGAINDVGAALRTNVPSSYRAGLELMWAVQLDRRITWRGNISFSRNKVRDLTEYVDDWDNGGQLATPLGERDLAFSPNLVASNELSFRFWDKPDRGHADLALVTKYVGRQFLDNTSSTDRMLDPFLVNDVRVNLALVGLKAGRSIDLNLTVRNVFSELYESNGWAYSFSYEGRRQSLIGLYPQAPVNVLGGVTLRF
jgi:iron complex outermembrane receptor protein